MKTNQLAIWYKVNVNVRNFGTAGLACLIDNAGIAYTSDELSAQHALETIKTNDFNTMKTTNALLPSLKAFAASEDGKRLAPRIIFVASRKGRLNQVSSSLQEKFATPNATHDEINHLLRRFINYVKEGQHLDRGWSQSMYGISELGLIAHSRILARELIQHGILVHACCPGWVQTDMTSGKGDKTPEEGAETPVWLATREIAGSEVKDKTGGFWGEKHLIDW